MRDATEDDCCIYQRGEEEKREELERGVVKPTKGFSHPPSLFSNDFL